MAKAKKVTKKATTKAAKKSGAMTQTEPSPKINHAALHRPDLEKAIDSATPAELRAIDADLAREGWDANGRTRKRIAERLAPPATSDTPQEG
jgi:hypothetical protein